MNFMQLNSGLDPTLKSKYRDLYRKLSLKLKQNEGILSPAAPAEVDVNSFYIDCQKYENRVNALHVLMLSIAKKVNSIYNIAERTGSLVSAESIPKTELTFYVTTLENELLDLKQKFDSIYLSINNLDFNQRKKLDASYKSLKSSLKLFTKSVNLAQVIARNDPNYQTEADNLFDVASELSQFVSYIGQILNSKNIR